MANHPIMMQTIMATWQALKVTRGAQRERALKPMLTEGHVDEESGRYQTHEEGNEAQEVNTGPKNFTWFFGFVGFDFHLFSNRNIILISMQLSLK